MPVPAIFGAWLLVRGVTARTSEADPVPLAFTARIWKI